MGQKNVLSVYKYIPKKANQKKKKLHWIKQDPKEHTKLISDWTIKNKI